MQAAQVDPPWPQMLVRWPQGSGNGATCMCLDKGDTSYTLFGSEGVASAFQHTDYPYGGSYRFREGYHWTGLNDMCAVDDEDVYQDGTVSASQANDVTEAIRYWSYAGPSPISTFWGMVQGRYPFLPIRTHFPLDSTSVQKPGSHGLWVCQHLPMVRPGAQGKGWVGSRSSFLNESGIFTDVELFWCEQVLGHPGKQPAVPRLCRREQQRAGHRAGEPAQRLGAHARFQPCSLRRLTVVCLRRTTATAARTASSATRTGATATAASTEGA